MVIDIDSFEHNNHYGNMKSKMPPADFATLKVNLHQSYDLAVVVDWVAENSCGCLMLLRGAAGDLPFLVAASEGGRT